MRVIVNADDLGIGERENNATFDLMEQGKVTSATILANGSQVESAAQRLKEFPHCSFGVHLCLTEFSPLSDPMKLTPLVGDNGEFLGNARDISIDSGLREGIFEEWSAQIEFLQKLEVPISHIDSHHHVHSVPALFPVLKAIQKKFGIKKVRITKNIASEQYAIGTALRFKKFLWNTALRYYQETATTDGFTSFYEFMELRKQQKFNVGSLELMVHPEGAGFEDETAFLRSNWIDDLSPNISLINYNEL